MFSQKNNFKNAKHFENKFQISKSTLRNWSKQGKIEFLRMPGGKRKYNEESVTKLFINSNNEVYSTNEEEEKKIVLYARVSSSKQKEDLERQVEELKREYPNTDRIIRDVGSGVNFKRKGLQTLLEQCLQGMVSTIVIKHRDRLSRLGFEMFQFIFTQLGIKLVVLCKSKEFGEDRDNELAEDLLSITTLFVASHHGKRAAENKRKKRKREEDERSNQRNIERYN